MKKPNFYREEISEYCKEYLTKSKYGDFVPLLEEIFQRRAYEFRFNNAQIHNEIRDFSKNIEKISILKRNPARIKKSSVIGCCRHKEREIEIYEENARKTLRKSDNELYISLFKTLTHEVYHGINGKDKSLVKWNETEKIRENIAANEIWVETAANRTSHSTNYEDFENYRAETKGYPSITFVSNLLAAAIGTNERNTIKAGIQGGNKNADLTECINLKYSKSRDYAEEILDDIMLNSDVVYNILYKSENGRNLSRKDKTVLKTNLSELYTNMYDLAILRNYDDTRGISATEEMKFRYNKMERITEDSLQKFRKNGYLSGGDLYDIRKHFKEEKEILKNQVIAINRIGEKRR